jgi:hypothetical protein
MAKFQEKFKNVPNMGRRQSISQKSGDNLKLSTS